MTKIIPAILTDSEDELVRLVRIFERAGIKRAQVDICDGAFVPSQTISGYNELRRLKSDIVFDIHLMVQNPEAELVNWCDIQNIDRLIVHVETTDKFGELCMRVKECNKKIGAAINSETPLEQLEAAIKCTDIVQFLTVHPGLQGREFIMDVLEHIKQFRAAHPDITIMVDGGITPDTAPLCINAGANTLVVGSYIIKAPNITEALRELETTI